MKILFVCHGNICRSTMAQSVMQNLAEKAGLAGRLSIDSRATHEDEIGEPPYYETVRVLKQNGVPVTPHKATLITQKDFDNSDLILIMDDENLRTLKRKFGADAKFDEKVKFLLEFSDATNGKTIADPYYTRDFERCYDDVSRSCAGLLEGLKQIL